MMERGIWIGILLVVSLFLVPSVLGEVYVGEVESLYNLGDIFNVSTYLNSNIDTVSFFNTFLTCGLDEIEIHKSVQDVGPENEKEILIKTALDTKIIGNLSGNCYIKAKFEGREARSRVFEIISDVNVRFNIEGASFLPGDIVNISGSVVKGNGEVLNGFVEITFEGLDLINYGSPKLELTTDESSTNENSEDNTDNEEYTDSEDEALKIWRELHPGEEIPAELRRVNVDSENGNESIEEINDTLNDSDEEDEDSVIKLEIESDEDKENFVLGSVISQVEDGQFSAVFIIPDNAPPGSYRVKVRGYDQNRYGSVMNEGNALSTMRINQVIQSINLAFNLDSIIPGNEFLFTPLVYDQAENQGSGELEIIVSKPDESVFMDKILKAGETYSIFVEKNFTPGYWKIESKFGEIDTEKTFFVEELEEVTSRLEEGTLIVRNTGNVVFDKPLEISIGDISEIKSLKLEMGESRRFRLAAPEGEYNIKVSDGQELDNLGVTFLTGRAISIDEIGGIISENFWMLVLLLAIVVFIVLIIIIIKILKRRSITRPPRLINTVKTAGKQAGLMPVSGVGTKIESRSVIDRGIKEEVSIISLKIKNLSEIESMKTEKDPFQSIDRALLGAKSNGAKIYVDKEYRVAIFAPSLTRGDFNLKAIKTANDINRILNRYDSDKNQKVKIEYGLSVHSGDMAIEKKDGKLKFVSLRNTVAIAKRLSEVSTGEVLLSDRMHKKTLGKVKVERKNGFWKVRRISDREQHEEFVSKFLKRQRESKR